MTKIQKLYNQIFDEEDNMKICGRVTCKQLLAELKKKFPEEDFGDARTGFLNTKKITAYKDKLF